MQIRPGLDIDPDRLAEICRRYGVAQLALFGSALADDFGPASDIDLLYVLEPGSRTDLVDLMALRDELSELFGRPVGLVWKQGLHWYIRDRVLAQARVLHAV